jgi:transcriptional regulator with XRE-family HTH domain
MKRRPIQERLGKAIQKRRKATAFTQEGFADHIKMHRSQYGFLEQGRKDARLSTLERVCNGLGITLAELMEDVQIDDP